MQEGCRSGIYKEITPEHAAQAKANGAIISSGFVVWQETGEGRKGRFVVNLSVQSKRWKKGRVRMESLPEFATEIQRGDHFLSMDISKGYRHFRLHPRMRDWFIFRWDGRYYQCVALPFGWGRSPLWFTQFMAIFVKQLRCLEFRVLAYLDDFLIAPTRAGVVARRWHCVRGRKLIDSLLRRLGLARHPTKGEWEGATTIDHLGVRIDSIAMRFHLAPRKIAKVQLLARKILREVRLGRRWVTTKLLRHFCGVCVSLTLSMPWARFYTRSLYWDMAAARPRDERGRCRLSHQSIRDLAKWKHLSGQELKGRPMVPPAPTAAIHTDAADVGYGGTLNFSDLSAGTPGQWVEQGVWNWRDRAESISYRELKAIRMVLSGSLGRQVLAHGRRNLLLHIDNQPVVHITNSFVSASRPMMRELRRLKAVLDHHGLHIRSEWIPSAANKFADGLSRRFPRGDLRIQRQVRLSVQAGMQAPVDSFPFRPLGEHPRFLRQQAYTELAAEWDPSEVRMLCPPVDLLSATVRKLRATGAPALLLMPDWPRQSWYAPALRLARRVQPLDLPPSQVWAAHRTLNPRWRLLLLDINLA